MTAFPDMVVKMDRLDEAEYQRQLKTSIRPV